MKTIIWALKLQQFANSIDNSSYSWVFMVPREKWYNNNLKFVTIVLKHQTIDIMVLAIDWELWSILLVLQRMKA